MIPEKAIAVIKEFEGWRIEAYLCPANVWTVGYGVTRINGRTVRKGDKLASEADGDRLLRQQLEADYLPKLRAIPGWDEMSDGQQAALISFAWNLGAGFYGGNGFATLTKHLKARDWDAVPAALLLYNKAGGRVLAGLARRRQREVDLWRGGSPKQPNQPNQSNQSIKPTEATVKDFYFLDFSLALDKDTHLEHGRLILRSINGGGGRTHQVWVSTTSLGTKQTPDGFHARGGPIPPEYRVPSIRSWDVLTTPIALPQTKGVEGSFYKILPFEVKTDKGGVRSDLGIHKDANVPGSMGCIVMAGDRFQSFEAEMTKLRKAGVTQLPLFINYPTD